MIKSAKTLAARFWKDESGASMIEYSILIALITTAVVTAVIAVQGNLTDRWEALQTILENALFNPT